MARKGRPKGDRKVRVDFRKNRGKTARDKGQWTRSVRDKTNKAEDADKSELVRAKGALSRKRTIIESDTDWDALIQGTVVRMVWSIKNYNGDNTISCESTIRALILDPWGNEESRRADIAKFQMFDQAQSAAVLAFLRFMNDIDGATNAILAIEKYWGRFALHTD